MEKGFQFAPSARITRFDNRLRLTNNAKDDCFTINGVEVIVMDLSDVERLHVEDFFYLMKMIWREIEGESVAKRIFLSRVWIVPLGFAISSRELLDSLISVEIYKYDMLIEY